MITPVPENPLSEDLIVPEMMAILLFNKVMLLARQRCQKKCSMRQALRTLNWKDWIGMVSMWWRESLVNSYNHEEAPEDGWEWAKWVTLRWEPIHNIELATKDIKELECVFDLFNNHIKVLNEAIEVLNSSKGLQQTIRAPEDLSLKLYKLRSLSTISWAHFLTLTKAFKSSLELFGKEWRAKEEKWDKLL